jgi:hypothetical protein
MHSPVKKMGQAVHIIHKSLEVTELGIIPLPIKVRGTIGIGEFLSRKGMGNKIVNPSHQHMIKHPFHITQTTLPAKGTKYLTEGSPPVTGIQVAQR